MANIMWKYLDKRAATIAAIRDYQSMKFIIQNTEKDIARVHAEMTNVSSINLERSSRSNNPGAHEERIVNSLERIDALKYRYEEALEYMAWFEPSWEMLREDERHVLGEFYWEDDDSKGISILDRLCEEYNIERTSVYKKKNRSLDKLTVLLYGDK